MSLQDYEKLVTSFIKIENPKNIYFYSFNNVNIIFYNYSFDAEYGVKAEYAIISNIIMKMKMKQAYFDHNEMTITADKIEYLTFLPDTLIYQDYHVVEFIPGSYFLESTTHIKYFILFEFYMGIKEDNEHSKGSDHCITKLKFSSFDIA
ncbi:27119_t:CDS:1 [Gigaspora margarita]|uniref:27119_t:CDS:1 n=1 Tax=Gigaspora margarita TaxID=4874 RepID=A0ABN7UQZ3_GIGMA|nr:27119_t:CDS:1 [Gigaspora margarita]